MRPPSGRWRQVGSETFAEVIRAYLASPKFAALARSTQIGYRQYLKLAELPEILGARRKDEIRPSLVQGFLDGLADRPGAQQRAWVALKAVEKWALPRDLLAFPIMTGTEFIRSKDGHRPWTDRQVGVAEECARSGLARAVTLAANTGQRGSDLVRMAWSDVEKIDGRLGVNVRQQKTSKELWVPFTQPLLAAVATWERRPGPILLRDDGAPWTRKQLTEHWSRERDSNPQLAPCSELVLHGLRATAVIRLRRAGAKATQIADMIGMSIAMVERYCRFADQRDNALAAVHYLDRTAPERPRDRSQENGN